MAPRTSPVVHETTSRMLDALHRDHITRNHLPTSGQRKLPRMRPYAEQLAYERGDD
ncbi:hypothetical protein GCM10011492_36520 [Flexivirga endophytica]|uniref:Uncharacterized protein n=1 Tax=Flexivirga endophytica TaxID=1849103 RepID=A0A916TEU3_9MICO|nr:hypothetical protein [Flexivirga endophytica]GGB42240.1 hypothetical protein GCM10011492_36520 [Flexivirga endophytica]GHB70434.1 hypothetical protein GCM10008112_43630 [Flexivirga endophytica]